MSYQCFQLDRADCKDQPGQACRPVLKRTDAMPPSLISSDPRIMMGKPTVSGTRITVEVILDKLAAGETVDQILSEYPRLTPEAVRAAIAFAAEALRADVVYPLEK